MKVPSISREENLANEELRGRLRVAENISELAGSTPMLHLRHISPAGGAGIYAKLENLNPGGSVKDRAALGIIEQAERDGKLRPGGTILEATAGNTGIGLAIIGLGRGYRVMLCVPEQFSEEKVMVMRALGAEVLRTPEAEGMQGAIWKAISLADEIPGAFIASQFENPANPDFHYKTTAAEIFEQMEGRIDAITIGAGTGGTFTGVARYLKERLPECLAYVVETQGSVFGGGPPGKHRVEGIGNSFIPRTLDLSLADGVITVQDDDSFATVLELARKEGVLGGGSSGANVWAAIQVARKLGSGKRVVTIIPDGSERYLSKGIFPKPAKAGGQG
ncbi:MAG: cysteine synthase family protein [Acidobacteria bacterium]|nr:cysteine synthase family protein [Acidobacteriota bacterium]